MTRQMLGKAQLPSEEHPMGVAVCGTPITPGLIVWTNEYKPGVVTDAQRHDPEWFDVRFADGGTVMQNGERVATVFEGKRAVDAWVSATLTRAERAEAALERYKEVAGPGLSDGEYLQDLAVDLLHLAQRIAQEDDDVRDAEQIHEWAMIHFEAEREDDES